MIILSDRVGAVITPAVSGRYNIFGGRGGFVKAVVLELPDSSCGILFTVAGGKGLRDTLVRYTWRNILMMAEKIQHFQELERGAYVMGSMPVRLTFPGRDSAESVVVYPPSGAGPATPVLSWKLEDELITESSANTWPSGMIRQPADSLPLARAPGLTQPIIYPHLALGIGIRTTSPSFSVSPGGAALVSSSDVLGMFSIMPELVLTEDVGIQIDWAFNLADCWTTGATVVLYTHPFEDPGVRPFVEAGAVWSYIHDYLPLEGDPPAYVRAHNGGFQAGSGVGFSLGSVVSLVLDVSYERIGKTSDALVDYVYTGGSGASPRVTAVSVGLSGFRFGARLKFE
ncbi:MAG TPA: hypothetical protein VMF59_09725 [Bacteroidota bacterium]|nr:hypothetical protein [Bacteroidota bacterium]